MLAGNFALAFCAIFIALGTGGLGLADSGLWLSAGAIVATRWLDVRMPVVIAAVNTLDTDQLRGSREPV